MFLKSIYFKEPLPVPKVNNNCISAYLVSEVYIQNRRRYRIVVYRSPRQSSSEFKFLFQIL